MLKRCLIITILIISISSVVPPPVAAQTIAEQVYLQTSPTNPRPGDTVTVNGITYLYELDTAFIQWYLDGALIKEGVGEKQFTFTLPNAEDTTTIRATFSFPGGIYAERSMQILPLTLDILWQANTMVPPFYRGKALPVKQSSVTFTALPDDSFEGNTIFNWSQNGQLFSEKSGVGKSSVTLQSSLLNQFLSIDVSAKSIANNQFTQGSTSVNLTDPQVVFYEVNERGDVNYAKTLTSPYAPTQEPIQIFGFPLFFSNDQPADITWEIAGLVSRDYEDRDTIYLSNSATAKQITSITAKFNHPNRILQTAVNTLNVFF